ncbi:MAG TPA: hypothetical protein VGN16_03070 [Acidobacteriaceae bacterium]
MNPVPFLSRSPDAAVLTATAGILLGYVEFNRPGLILPGSLGLLAILLAAAGLFHTHLTLFGLVCLALTAGLLLVSLKRAFSPWLALAATAGITLGCWRLVDGPGGLRVHPATALFAGILLGPGTSLLTAIARRARTNKGLD